MPLRNAWLDACRAMAILLVLLSHGRFFLRDQIPVTEALRFGGFIGVELFFVLSGFLIGGILLALMRHGESQPWRDGFYARRWLRTLPNYYLFLALNLVLAWTQVRPGEADGQFWRYMVFLQNFAWATPTLFSESWSLAVEELFYLVFPLLVLGLGRAMSGDRDRAMLAAAMLIIVGSLVGRIILADAATSWDEQVRKVAIVRLDALMFGVLLAWLNQRNPALLVRHKVIWVGLGLFLACTLYAIVTRPAELDGSWFAKTLYLTLAPLGCASVIAIGLHWRLPAMMATTTGFLARVSYSAYLANIPVAMFILHFSRAHETSLIAALLAWGVFMTTTLLVAWLCYRAVERPILQLRDRYFPGPRAVRA